MTYGTRTRSQADASHCGCQEHLALLNAIRLGDRREAERLMQAHLEQLESQLQFHQTDDQGPDLLSLFSPPQAAIAER